MTARTHDLAAITGLAAVVFASGPLTLNLSTVLVALLANMIGGIAPDIDQPTAPFWRNLPIGGMFGRMIDRMLGGHRFLTHSLIGLFLFGFAVHWLLIFVRPIMGSVNIDYVWWAFMVGMVSHLVMDTFTKEGVPWLLPIPIKFGIPPIKALRISTGKALESVIVFPLLILINLLIYSAYYQELLTILHSLR